jgi:LysM repeat protein
MKKILCLAALSAGTVLALSGAVPAQEAPAPSDQPPAHTPYTVAPGDSLSGISQARLGTADRWIEVFAVNREIIVNPDLIEVGQVLNIPSAPVAVPADLLASLAPPPAPARSSRSATTSSDGGPSQADASEGGGSGYMASIRECESGGDYGYNDGQFHGAYNFDAETWQSVGGEGTADQASPAEQDARASRLLNERGSSPWPNCG